MTQPSSARRTVSLRGALLVLLALAVLVALAYVFSRPAAPPAPAPTAVASIQPAATEPTSAGAAPTDDPAGVLTSPQAPSATPEAPAALSRVTPSRTPTRRATLTATATPRFVITATSTRKSTRQPTASRTPTRKPTRQPSATPTRKPTRQPSATPTRSASLPSAPLSGLPTIQYDRLPKEARATIDLILQGGPFPYSQDGVVFQNRERILPRKASGYYHEYTVKTPGSLDRGPRRIVTGEGGEFYYTDDHYDSFRQVTP